MNVINVSLLILLGLHAATGPGDSCLDRDALLRLDRSWEQAVLHQDTDHLRTLLAEAFIWVHNHASQTDSKESLIREVSERDPTVMHSRESSDVDVRILGQTGVVTGFTVVDREDAVTRYNFMRTYVEKGGSCYLLANHTMALPKEAD
jgi:hypothetical protein